MSNRTDYTALAYELAEQFGLSGEVRKRVEGELHNAHVAGQEGSDCDCASCVRLRMGGEEQWKSTVLFPGAENSLGAEARTIAKRIANAGMYRFVGKGDCLMHEAQVRNVSIDSTGNIVGDMFATQDVVQNWPGELA